MNVVLTRLYFTCGANEEILWQLPLFIRHTATPSVRTAFASPPA